MTPVVSDIKNRRESKEIGFKKLWAGIRTIFRHGRDYKRDLYIIAFLFVCISLLEGMLPYVFGMIFDSITHSLGLTEPDKAVYYSPYIILCIWIFLQLFQEFLTWINDLRSYRTQELIVASYKSKAHRHLFKLPMSYHKTHRTGETAEKINRATQAIFDVFGTFLLEHIPGILTIIVTLGVAVYIHPLFGAVFMLGAAAAGYLSYRELGDLAGYQRELQDNNKEARGIMQDAINNIKSVKDFAAEEYEYKRIEDSWVNKSFNIWNKLFSKRRGTASIQRCIYSIARSLVFLAAIYLVSTGEVSIGQAFVAVGIVHFRAFNVLLNQRYRLQNNVIAIEEAENILNTPIEDYHEELNTDPQSFKGNIKFEKVFFTYEDGKDVLKNINCSIDSGNTVAIVGESGVGKSTFIDLISAYNFPQSGQVIIDDTPTTNINLKELRSNIAVVTQEISLFNDTIANNIRYGSFDASFSKVERAAELAHCTEFINKAPMGFDQLVGERGMKLSVGQKQRIAIARAILRDPKILILDEPTSALDASSEKIVTDALNELMKNRTTIIIAHRLSTVRRADKILVLKDGRIIEEGKHAALIKKRGGEYKRLYDLQIGLHE